LTCLIDPQLPAQVLGDPTRVRQIISNLLSNALKFTRFGRVDIHVDNGPTGIRILVRDTGIGIAEEARARIYQPFAQAGVGITRQFGGTGLGLALTRRLCEAMQGRLELESREGFGSQFCAELPLPSHTPAPALPALTGTVVALSSANSGLSELLGKLLPAWGLGYQRLDTDTNLLGVTADLLISDCPECLPNTRPTCTMPILLVTAYGSFLPSEQTHTLAPFEQIARPLSRQTLLQALRRSLGQQMESAPAPSPIEQQSGRRARVLLVEDNPVNQLVAKGMLGKLGCEVVLANHGAEALSQLAQHDIDLVLMDCNMPIMDGYEASRRIRQGGHHPELPIIALTANALPDERERCRAAGMSDYLAKPFRREELAALLERWLSASSAAP
jgi:CheY-like chemotaxis protein